MKEENNENNSLKYFVPPNVSARFEIIEGFGIKELIVCSIALLIGVFLTFTTGLIATRKIIKVEDLAQEKRVGIEAELKEITESTPIIPMPIRVIFFIAIPTAGAFAVVRKNPITGMSIEELIKGRNEYKKRQKRYLYKYDSGG